MYREKREQLIQRGDVQVVAVEPGCTQRKGKQLRPRGDVLTSIPGVAVESGCIQRKGETINGDALIRITDRVGRSVLLSSSVSSLSVARF